ncbi:MAG: sigma-54 dependent transcriptional regulator [Burkholderiaceae bacterium]
MSQASLPSRNAVRAGKTPRVLVVDDEADLRELLDITLIRMGLDVDCAASLAEARRFLSQNVYALCLTDMRLPDGEGLQLVSQINRETPNTPVAVITAYGSTENAIAALKSGAFDYLAKPVALEALRSLVRSAVQFSVGESRGAQEPATELVGQLLGDSQAMAEVRASIMRLARSMAPVAITGESGSGKELAARLVHQTSARAAQPFIAVNCGAIPETLMESEFFGYKRGAFTGADQDRDGFFQAANGGTLFLDEVADLPLPMQVKLLRAIQEKRVRKVGATSEDPVDVRIVSATHQDLAQCVAAGRFRQDLYYRLNVIELKLPPLRDRPGDIPALAEATLARLSARAGLDQVPRLASVTAKYLQSYAFPGNVRELENILERAMAFSNGEVINVEDLGLRPTVLDADENERDDLPEDERGASSQGGPQIGDAAGERRPVKLSPEGIPASLPDYLDQVEREAIQRALERTRYNRTAAAKLLGITFRALRYRMHRLGLN